MSFDDTIAAISTPLGEGGIGIVRISGAEAYSIGKRLFVSQKSGVSPHHPRSHHLYYGHLYSCQGELIDEVLLSFMKSPHTYTREDTVEINCHSGVFTLRTILNEVLRAGARQARPGEFTKRAFLNGRIDLGQAESTLKLIRARSKEGAKAAAANVKGKFSKSVKALRERMLLVLARIEAHLDFPEELEDDRGWEGGIREELEQISTLLEKMARTAERGDVMQAGLVSAIAGKPNAGKSSLLNALLQEQRAIVHELPGTTRDPLEGYLTISGYPLRLIDTAGIHGSDDPVEQAGIRKAEDAVSGARLIIFVLDGSTAWDKDDETVAKLIKPDQMVVLVINKNDLPQQLDEALISERFSGYPVVRTEAIKNEGVEHLEEIIAALLDCNLGTVSPETPVAIHLRHARAVEVARACLDRAMKTFSVHPIELVALDLEEAWHKLGEITGDSASEELIDKIFSEFCIGK